MTFKELGTDPDPTKVFQTYLEILRKFHNINQKDESPNWSHFLKDSAVFSVQLKQKRETFYYGI